MGLEDELELVNFPTEEDFSKSFGTYKVIQMYIGQKPVMVFGSIDVPHFVILGNFLDSRGVEFAVIHPQLGGRIPSVGGEGQPYSVVGGGFGYIDNKHKQFKLPEGDTTFHGRANPEHSAIFERRMVKDGWVRFIP